MLFYFIRHGQTEANRKHLIAGAGLDLPLNEEGHRQAAELAGAFRTHVAEKIHRLYVSSLMRTHQTADYLARELQLTPQAIVDFREWEFGQWEGQSSAAYVPLMLGDADPEGGETRKAFYRRVEEAWKGVHHDQEPYVIVAHGGVWLAFQDFLGMPRFAVSNCQLVRLELGGGRWSAKILR